MLREVTVFHFESHWNFPGRNVEFCWKKVANGITLTD